MALRHLSALLSKPVEKGSKSSPRHLGTAVGYYARVRGREAVGMVPQDIEHLEETLLQNALAFLGRGIEGTTDAEDEEDSHQALSFAVVDVAVALEVMLKARLVREHWTLILSTPNRETQQRLLSGEAKTVSPEEAIKRLADLVSLDLKATGPCKSFMEEITHIFKYRNRAAHFSLSQTSDEAIKAQLVNALAFAVAFLGEEWPEHSDEVATLTRSVSSLKEFVSKRMDSLEEVLSGASTVVRCPYCFQAALVVEEVGIHCCYCLYDKPEEGDRLADDYVEECLGVSAHETVKDGGEWPVVGCPDCSSDALVHEPEVVRSESSPDWLCFSCGVTHAEGVQEQCRDCGRVMLTHGEDGIGLCRDCFAYHIEHA